MKVKVKSRNIIIGILLVAILSMLSAGQLLAQTAGSISLEGSGGGSFAAPDGSGAGTVTVTVEDEDEDVPVAVANEAIALGDLSAGVSAVFFLTSFPVTGTPTLNAVGSDTSNGSGGAEQDETDPLVLEVVLESAVQGRIRITAGPGGYGGTAATNTIDYDQSIFNSVAVVVTSTVGGAANGGEDVNVTLSETLVESGIFVGTFDVLSNANLGGADSDASDEITGKAGTQVGTITVTYADVDPEANRVATIAVEDTDPEATVVSPADDLRTTSEDNTLIVDFTDLDSGIDEDSIDSGDFSVAVSTGGVTVGSPTVTDITGGFRVEVDLTDISTDTTVTVTWSATVVDIAGNIGTTGNIILVVDQEAPTLNSAMTGAFWDTSLETPATVGGAGDEENSINTSIMVTFNEDLDGATVSASDFEVDGIINFADPDTTSNNVTPTDAQFFSDAPTLVFLTVPAMAANSTPNVALTTAGSVLDSAGNSQGTGDADAADEIAPTITYTLSATLVQGGDDLTLTISADEPVTTPVVEFNNAGQGVSLVDVATNTYEVTFSPDENGTDDGAYGVEIDASDPAGNPRSLGDPAPAISDIVFEVDTDLPDPGATVPTQDGTVEIANPLFVTIDWTAEDEYGDDTHTDVTITAATLDGVDVLAGVSTTNDQNFVAALSGIAVGDHTLALTAADEAGNTNDFELDFEVTARADYTVPLTPGWNLISLPGTPDDTAINSVLPSSHPATAVLTFDPTGPTGGFEVAVRDPGTGLWVGDLATIDSEHAYWVNTPSSEPLETLLEVQDIAFLLPTIAVTAGWNLLPVIDLEQNDVGELIDADEYFGSISWSVAYSFTTLGTIWVRVVSEDDVVVGKGYWVWVTAAGTLVP